MFGILGLFFGCLVIATHAQDDSEKELKNTEGVYVMVSGELKGDNLPEKTVKTATLTMEGDKHLVKVGDDTIIGTHKLAPAKKLKEIDSTDTEGPHKGKTTLGIYKLENGEFTVCFAAPGKDRPTEFTTKAEIYHIWKKK